MTTLETIGVTLGAGCIILALSVLFFGIAISRRSTIVAPRATARPRNVIYYYKDKTKDNGNDKKTATTQQSTSKQQQHHHHRRHVQDRGSPFWGWIPWSMSLTYDTMLKGVPGTGTRRGGLDGSMLKVTMDGIVLLRFHALGRKIALFASCLCIVILLPLYYTAQCSGNYDPALEPSCNATNYNLTNFDQTTLANVPSANRQLLERGRNGIVGRLYGTSLCFAILVLYVLYLLNQEWQYLLAMRRVYYLEADVWGDRRRELKNTLLYEDMSKPHHKQQQTHDNRHAHFDFEEDDTDPKKEETKETERNGKFASRPPPVVDDGEKEHLVDRDPWIPHPEQRDLIPNVSLYSVLVGGLPSLPEEVLNELDVEMATLHSQSQGSSALENTPHDAVKDLSKRKTIDWQLELTTTLFDHCVPNQPGFSSSVAAVTIIPGAKAISDAWKKWYAAASKLRRLRFIRKQIRKLREYDIPVEEDDITNGKEEQDNPDADEVMVPVSESGELLTSIREGEPATIDNAAIPAPMDIESAVSPTTTELSKETPRSIYGVLDKKASYFREVTGSVVNGAFDDQIFETIFGPEQTAVYSREFAQAAAPCCPNGCREDRILRAGIDELLEMEREAVADVHKANVELNNVRHKIAVAVPEAERKSIDVRSIFESNSSGDDMHTAKKGHRKTTSRDLALESDLFQKTPPRGEKFRNRNESTDTPISATGNILEASETSIIPLRKPKKSHEKWNLVESIVKEGNMDRHTSTDHLVAERRLTDGVWHCPSFSKAKYEWGRLFTNMGARAKLQMADLIESYASDSTYAIITFTSRQAAVAARNCLADGRGMERWIAIKEIPIPPLADASTCDPLACRNCCRPVTVSINNRQKNCRRYVVILMLATIYIFYTIPLTFATNILSANALDTIFPGIAGWSESRGVNLSGLISAAIYTGFFASCPILFKAISNFGSGSFSVAQAEFMAIQYYWWFMVLTAFSGALLASMTIQAINNGLSFGSELTSVLRTIAATIPTTVAAAWLNWIIFRFTITLPLNYLLFANAFIFKFIGWNCCSRMMIGGGPGGPAPYRIYVDSGVVIMCILALGPSSPLVALASFVYFIVCEPLFRRNLIFVYRQKFDGGGARWVYLHQMIISAIFVGIILLVTQMALKLSVGAAVIAALPVLPTLLFHWHVKAKYKPAFDDAALLQTAFLDGWDTSESSSVSTREEFRRFLVDAHKAAYVPVCIAGADTEEFLTAEPAVVLPLATDQQDESPREASKYGDTKVVTPVVQHGAKLGRSAIVLAAASKLRKRAQTADGALQKGEDGTVSGQSLFVGTGSLDEDDKDL